MNTISSLAAATSMLLVGACGTSKAQQSRVMSPQQLSIPTTTQQPASNATHSGESSANVTVAEDIQKACGLSVLEARFAYDSAQVRDRDRAILSRIAECFTSGPLQGREMRLVGHADSRGEQSYNLVLGQSRADNIKRALVGVGMVWNQVATTSRGEFDATGTDESGWARDRRVDIMLAE